MYEEHELKYQFDLQGHRRYIETLSSPILFARVTILAVIVFQDGIYRNSQPLLRDLRRWYFQHLTILHERVYSREQLASNVNYYAAHFAGFNSLPDSAILRAFTTERSKDRM